MISISFYIQQETMNTLLLIAVTLAVIAGIQAGDDYKEKTNTWNPQNNGGVWNGWNNRGGLNRWNSLNTQPWAGRWNDDDDDNNGRWRYHITVKPP